MEILNQLIRRKEELDGLRPLDPEQEAAIMQKFRLDWNYHSNHLEGNTLTYGETKALILHNITAQGKPLQDHIEMTGHNEAIKWIEEVVKEQRPLSQAFIRNLHQLILKESYEVDAITPEGKPTKKTVLVGEYKKTPNHVKTQTGEIVRFATPEETPGKMGDLIKWYEQRKGDMQPLLLAAEFHYKFIRIHPFDDGNGRTARILMNFILMQGGYPPTVIKTEDKQNYFAALQLADAGTITPFIEYIGNNLVHSFEIMIKGAKGESIDEPDDVDKEIALIEQRLKEADNALSSKKKEITRSKQTILELYDSSLKPLFNDFESECRKFQKFYNKLYFGFLIDNHKATTSIKDTRKFIEKESVKQNLRFRCQFVSFTNKTLENITPFNEAEIKIEFRMKEYVVKGVKGIILKKSYGNEITEEERQLIIRKDSKAHTAFINEQIEKNK